MLLCYMECAKFRGSRVILGLEDRGCHSAIVLSWVRNFFRWYFVGLNFFLEFRGSKIFSLDYFVGPTFFSREDFVGPKFFLVGILWVQGFISWLFRGSKII